MNADDMNRLTTMLREHFPDYRLITLHTDPHAGIGPIWEAQLAPEHPTSDGQRARTITVEGDGSLDPTTWKITEHFT